MSRRKLFRRVIGKKLERRSRRNDATEWALTLECGHIVWRCVPAKGIVFDLPKKCLCYECSEIEADAG